MFSIANQIPGFCLSCSNLKEIILYLLYVILSIRNIIEVPPGLVMMAGLVDTNVHIQDPGRGDWEGFAAATKAAGLRRH